MEQLDISPNSVLEVSKIVFDYSLGEPFNSQVSLDIEDICRSHLFFDSKSSINVAFKDEQWIIQIINRHVTYFVLMTKNSLSVNIIDNDPDLFEKLCK